MDMPTGSGSAAPLAAPLALPIALNVITGFLGAGKTTLLNRLLKDPAMADAAVVVNEFGEIGIDHLLVERSDESIIEMSSGCLCCTVRGDLVRTLEDLAERVDDGRLASLSRVVIETTGLADPAPVLHTIMRHPVLLNRYRLDSVITLVDGVNGMGTLDTAEEAVKQAAVADRLVITKTDLMTDAAGQADLGRLRERLRRLNPAAPILTPDAPLAALTGAGLWNPATKAPDVARWLNEEALRDRAAERHGFDGGHDHHDHGHDHHDHGHHEDDHDHHGHHHHGHDDHDHGDHHHDVNRHDARIRAFCLATDRPVSATALEFFLDLLRSGHGPRLLRMKGIVRLADDPERPLVLHAVQHVLHPPTRLAAWPDADRRTRLVFITRDLEEAFVSRMFGAIVGDIRPDTPDRDALVDNPLAIAGFGGRFAR